MDFGKAIIEFLGIQDVIIEDIKRFKKRATKTVPREAYPALGFRYDMTLEEAKERASQLNTQTQLEAKKIAGAVRRLEHEKIIDEVYLPPKMVALFKEELDSMYQDNVDRLDTILKHWKAAEALISELALDPKDFYTERHKILNYYKKKLWSPDYIKRLNNILNRWGSFYSRRNNSFFQALPRLTGNQVQRVVELREDVEDVRVPAKPLIWDDLKNKKSTFLNDDLIRQWNWLFIALWFGLRPTEVDNLKKSKFWNVTYDSEYKCDVLNVYQTKLTSLTKEERWKPIPIFFPEQKQALKLIKSGELVRPLNKTIQDPTRLGLGIETYSPRKGFTDLMLSLGVSLEDASIFLGHNNISTAWKHYKNKKKFKLPKAS